VDVAAAHSPYSKLTYTRKFRIEFDSLADHDAVVTGPNVRFTVLASRLIRMEHSPTGEFEDRPSQAFWRRRQPVPRFEASRTGGHREDRSLKTDLHQTSIGGAA
jgi:hypothetical protein